LAVTWPLWRHKNDWVLFDIVEGMPQGKALDIAQSTPIDGLNSNIIGTNDYKDIEGADVVIITAGRPRTPGMSRDDLLNFNAKIISDVAKNVKKYAPESIVIVISNPLDAMVYLFSEVSGIDKRHVVGMSGVLDASRFRTFISMVTGISVADIRTFVLGGHGDNMVPLARYSFIGGIPLPEFPGMSEEKIEAMVERTRKGGGEIVGLLKTGSAFYAPAAGAMAMAEAIILDQKRVFSAAAALQGEYGYEDMFISVPVVLGGNGVERILEIELTPKEKEALDRSADGVTELKAELKKMNFL